MDEVGEHIVLVGGADQPADGDTHEDGVSEIQELQMVTQEGGNVGVSSVVGNFDDAQAGVKQLFADEGLAAELAERGYFLSSANSLQKAVHDIDHPLLVGHVPHGLHRGGGQPGQHCRGH